MSVLPNPELTQAEKTAIAVRNLVDQSNGSLDNLKGNVKICWALFWNNPDVAPQEICDALGNNAYKIFQAASLTQALIKQLDPSYTVLVAPNNFTVNQDGTVDIGEPIESENENENS